jgi:hypothetical protein
MSSKNLHPVTKLQVYNNIFTDALRVFAYMYLKSLNPTTKTVNNATSSSCAFLYEWHERVFDVCTETIHQPCKSKSEA